MTVPANQILVRTLTCYRAFMIHPELHGTMRPALRASLESLAKQIEAVLPVSATGGTQQPAPDPSDVPFGNTRSALARLQHCLRGWYSEHDDVLRALPLTLGDDPSQDLIRLTTLANEIPKIKSPFAFIPPPDLVAAKLKGIISAHTAVTAATSTASDAEKALHMKQIALRPLAHALWRKEGLDAWIVANVPTYEEQIAFGRERRHRPRKPGDGEGEGAGSGGEEASAKKEAPVKKEMGAPKS